MTDNVPALVAELESLSRSVERDARNALEAAGFSLVDFARSETEAMRPPARAGEGERPAHPGGWADVTGNTSASYGHKVTDEGGGLYRLSVFNSSEVAEFLERRGFWVVSGLEEGGHIVAAVEAQLRAIVEARRIEDAAGTGAAGTGSAGGGAA